MKKFELKIIMSSGSTIWYDHYLIENVKNFFSQHGYYYFLTDDGTEYYFPVDRTIIKIVKNN